MAITTEKPNNCYATSLRGITTLTQFNLLHRLIRKGCAFIPICQSAELRDSFIQCLCNEMTEPVCDGISCYDASVKFDSVSDREIIMVYTNNCWFNCVDSIKSVNVRNMNTLYTFNYADNYK